MVFAVSFFTMLVVEKPSTVGTSQLGPPAAMTSSVATTVSTYSPAFDEDVRLEALDEFEGRVFLRETTASTAARAAMTRARSRSTRWARGAFEAADGGISVEPRTSFEPKRRQSRGA